MPIMPPFYIMNQQQQQQQPTGNQSGGQGPQGPNNTATSNPSTHNKIKKAVVSINEGNSNTPNNQRTFSSTSNNQNNTNSTSATNNQQQSNPNGQFHQQMIQYGPPAPSAQNHAQYIYSSSGPTMSNSSTSSQVSQFSYQQQQSAAGIQFQPQHPNAGPNVRMIIPNNHQFYPQTAENHQTQHPQVFYPQMHPQMHPQQQQQQQQQFNQNQNQQQQNLQQPPPSSTPSNIIHNQSAPHTPSPMPSQTNVFIPPNSQPGNQQQGPPPSQPPNAQQSLIYQPQVPPYYMNGQGYPGPGYIPQSPAGVPPVPHHQQPGFQGYPIPPSNYRKQ